MRYLSVCSGIEAATVAWHPLGWTPVAFSEIEAFPSAVLAHHYPDIPNYGDMTQHEQWPITRGAVDLLVGGTPCQSFSVAGLRKGLKDPRGGLMLTYLEIAQRLRPRWVVWENVPGVLSSNGGRDFGSFLGALGELGYGWAYRVLDAQWCRTHRHPRAVPQRRRRVFVIGRLLERGTRDWNAAAAICFESQSVQRNPSARRSAVKGIASNAESGTGAGGEVAGTIAARFGQSRNNHEECVAQPVPYDLYQITAPINRQNRQPGAPCHTLARDNAAHAAIAIQGNLVGRDTGGPHGVGASEEGAMYTLTKADTHAVAFHPTQDPISSEDGSTHCMGTGTKQGHATIAVATSFIPGNSAASRSLGETVECSVTVKGDGGGSKPHVQYGMAVRRLTPRECERLQGFPDSWTEIPWRGKPASECPDGPRYRALGNSMAVNCMSWIGERIAAQEVAQ